MRFLRAAVSLVAAIALLVGTAGLALADEPPQLSLAPSAPTPSAAVQPSGAPRERPTVLVHLVANPGVTLEASAPDENAWSQVCEAPCDKVLPLERTYRVIESDTSSAPFNLGRSPGRHVVLTVSSAPRGARADDGSGGTTPSPSAPDEPWGVHLFVIGMAEFESDATRWAGFGFHGATAFGAKIGLFVAVKPWLAVGVSGSSAPSVSLEYDCSGPCNGVSASHVRGMLEGRLETPVIPSRLVLWLGLGAGIAELTGTDQSPGIVVQAAAGGDLRLADVFWLVLSPRLLAQDVEGSGNYTGALLGAGIDLGIQIGNATTN
jgi:hypothetical protein